MKKILILLLFAATIYCFYSQPVKAELTSPEEYLTADDSDSIVSEGDVQYPTEPQDEFLTSNTPEVPDALAASTGTTNCHFYMGSNLERHTYFGWAHCTESFLSVLPDGNYMSVQAIPSEKVLQVEYYGPSYNFLREKIIGYEMEIFGGFFYTDSAYYVLTGQGNRELDPEKIVYRLEGYALHRYDFYRPAYDSGQSNLYRRRYRNPLQIIARHGERKIYGERYYSEWSDPVYLIR